eukprot:2336931-Pyramimonas_sp.AAC.1
MAPGRLGPHGPSLLGICREPGPFSESAGNVVKWHNSMEWSRRKMPNPPFPLGGDSPNIAIAIAIAGGIT